MPKPYTPPTGRLKTKQRSFEEVVRDVRHAVFSVVRMRPTATPNVFDTIALGSGFFVSPTLFMTCYHVFDSKAFPHKDGDNYRLIANVGNGNPVIHEATNVQKGSNLHFYPNDDMALLQFPAGPARPFVALDYKDKLEGCEIGIAGYPLGQVVDINGQQGYKHMIFRVVRSIVTASYLTDWTDEFGTLTDVPVIELHLMITPGNSGGPVFDLRTGRVVAFVKGFRPYKSVERLEKIQTPNLTLPAGMSQDYMTSIYSVYSYAVKMERVRPNLEAMGIKLD